MAETTEHSSLAFRVGLFGLEMARPPATTKPLEVKLANQESELMGLLRRITPGPEELSLTRLRAEQLTDGTLRSRGPALLPIMLATFIFDALVAPSVVGEERKTVCIFAHYFLVFIQLDWFIRSILILYSFL